MYYKYLRIRVKPTVPYTVRVAIYRNMMPSAPKGKVKDFARRCSQVKLRINKVHRCLDEVHRKPDAGVLRFLKIV